LKIADGEKGIVIESIRNLSSGQFEGKPVVAVEIELESKGAPGGDPQVAEPKLFVDEVKVVVKALAGIMFKECLSSRFVMPGLVAGAGFHGGKDMYKTGLSAPCFQYLLNAVFLAEGFDLSDELDFDTVFLCDALSVFADRLPERLGKLRIIKYPDLV